MNRKLNTIDTIINIVTVAVIVIALILGIGVLTKLVSWLILIIFGLLL